jgi:hypothetical protein
MTTKKSKIKTKNLKNRKTKNRIKGGSIRSNERENQIDENPILSRIDEINLHLGEITNAIRACCKNHANLNINLEDVNENSTSYGPMHRIHDYNDSLP